MNQEQAVGKVNIVHGQVESFDFAQTAAVNQLQRGAVADVVDTTPRRGNFNLAQNYFLRTVFLGVENRRRRGAEALRIFPILRA